MNNEELMNGIALCFRQCLDSYKLGQNYAGTEMHQHSLSALKELLKVLVQRASFVEVTK